MSVDFEIMEHIATLSKTNSTSKEINLVSWEDRDPKYDIRRWKSTGEPGKGVTLTEEEFEELKNVLGNTNPDFDEIRELIRTIEWIFEYDENSYGIDGGWFDIVESTASLDLFMEDDGSEVLDFNMEIPFDNSKYYQALELANNINIWCYENEFYPKAFIEKKDSTTLNICGLETITDIDLFESRLDLIEDLILQFQDDFLNLMHEEDEEDEEDDEYEEEDDDEIETQRILLDDFVVIGDSLSCVHEDHETVEIIAEIDFIDLSGDITTMETNAFYCEECGTYYIRQYDYRTLLAKAGNKKIMCQVIMEEKYWNNPDSVFFTMNDESILHKLGYNLTSGLSDKQRRGILKSVINNGIRSKEEVISFLSYQIKFKRNNPKMERSIKTWEEDRDYIIGYDSPNRQRVRPQRIDVTEYIKE